VENYLIFTSSTPEKSYTALSEYSEGLDREEPVKLSRAEKPEDKYWTVEIIG
jgi:hypothetical protein